MSASGWAKGIVLRLARVPADPEAPEGSQDSARVFNAGRNYLAWRLIWWAVANAAIAILLLFGYSLTFIPTMHPQVRTVLLVVVGAAATIFLISLPITYFLQLLNYQMRWYIVTDRSLLIRSGIVFLQEMTMTFANIQEIRVNANPIERLLGLANVDVRSAGGGDEHGSSGHVGKFEGVDNATAIRDLIAERLRVYRDSGLGEKTATAHVPPAVSAAQEVLQETRTLREALATRLT